MQKKELINLLNERYQNDLAQIVVSKELIFSEINNLGIEDEKEINWYVRKENGILYGYKYKPDVQVIGGFLSYYLEVKAVDEDETLIKEKDKNMDFIPKNKLIFKDDCELLKLKSDNEG